MRDIDDKHSKYLFIIYFIDNIIYTKYTVNLFQISTFCSFAEQTPQI